MKKQKIIASIILFALFCLYGCCRIPPEQEEWHRRRLKANGIVQRSLDKRAALTSEQLIAIVGEPDLIVDFDELQAILSDDSNYRNRVMSDICYFYCRVEKYHDECNYLRKDEKWTDYKEVQNCDLWLYDESQHFRKPPDSCCPFCAKVGFTCIIFFVEDSQVIGSSLVEPWKPLDKK